MRVFVTGASGFIGSALVKSLINSHHRVLGLARSDISAQAVINLGAEVLRGDLYDLETLRRGAEECDAVAHLGFNHDFSKYLESCEHDRLIIEALGSPLIGTDKPLVISSGTMLLPQGQVSTEKTRVVGTDQHPRAASEESADEMLSRGVRIAVVRLPPLVHGAGDHGVMPILIDLARKKRSVLFVGEGNNRWTAVHRLDAAEVFRLALEKSVAGARYHAVAEEAIPYREMAKFIGRKLDLPVLSKPPGPEVNDYFGWLSFFATMDTPATNFETINQLQWQPIQPPLFEDLENVGYFL